MNNSTADTSGLKIRITASTTAGGGSVAWPLALEVEANQGYQDYEGPQAYRDFPLRFSLPLPEGACSRDEKIAARVRGGSAVACDARPLLFWPDGSVRVWDIALPVSLGRGEKCIYEIAPNSAADASLPQLRVAMPAACRVTLTLDDGALLSCDVLLDAEDDAPRSVRTFSFALEGEGGFAFRGQVVRHAWSWYRGQAWDVRLTNYCEHEVAHVRSLTLSFDVPGSGESRYITRQTAFTAAGHPRLAERNCPLHVIANGGIRVADAAQLGENENDYPPYERGGYVLTVSPWLSMIDDEAAWTLVMPDAAERGPKAWRFEGRRVIVDLHPESCAPLHWRQGMTLYQRIVLLTAAPSASATELESEAQAWLRPPVVRLGGDVYRAAGWRIPFRFDPARFPRTEFHFRDSFNFSWTPGTFNFGDQLAGSKGGAAIETGSGSVARNLEYDFPAVAAKEYARTGGFDMWKMCRDSAQHMMHTDFVAYSHDQWTHGGICHHCPDHTNGSAYPSHMWAEGLTLYYQLSGDEYAAYVFRRVGDFYLKYIRERFAVVQGTAREVGWSLIALAAIYDVTREERYLDGIRRVVDYNIDRGRAAFFPTDACFTIGVAIVGLDRTRHFHRGEDSKRFIIELLDWMLSERRDGIGLFEYWRDPEKGAIPYVQTHLPEALNIGYLLSGDERYLRAAWRLYQIHQGGGLLTVQNRISPPECGFAAGNHISWMGCLASFAAKGWLDQLQYREPD